MASDVVVAGAHRPRAEDFLELVERAKRGRLKIYLGFAAGINVMCAFNVQHLESLKDVVERVAGVPIRETVPDTFLKQADQVVTLDLSVEDLLERLRAGKIYAEDKITTALANFFKPANLA